MLHFIIALLLVKSKPSNLSSSDFRKQLISYIEKGPRSSRSTQADAHLDTTAFWRNRSTKLEEEKAALEAKVSRLQARVSELEKGDPVRKEKGAEVDHSAPMQRLKRSRDGEPGEEHNSRSAKQARTKIGVVALDERDAVLQNILKDESGSEWDDFESSLLDSLRILQGSSTAKRGNTLGPKDLAHHLSSIATHVCRHVSVIDLTNNFQKVTSTALLNPTPISKEHVAIYPQTGPEDITEQWLAPIERMFPHFLAHLHTLSQFSGSGNLCGEVVYRFIHVFRVLYQRICDLAVANARSNQDTPQTMKKRDGCRKKQITTSSSDGRPATSPIIMRLCKFVISMVFNLDPMMSTHKAILEGCFYLLLTRVGEALKEFTIGGRPFGIQEEDTISRYSLRSREMRQLNVPGASNDAEASKAQAPYLIWMLNRIQRFNSSMNPATSATTTSHDNHRQPEIAEGDSSRHAIHDDARIRLQHTLVRAIFGEQAVASFEPALEPPCFPPDDERMTDFDTQNETADVGDWFKNEVWRLVGWDVLRGNIAWD